MKVLVTGGTGFIGTYFVPMLLQRGYSVRLLVRDKAKAVEKFGDSCEYFVGDVTDRQSLNGCCEGIDIVYHLVAKSGNELPTENNFKIFRDINVGGTKNLLEECDGIQRFIYISSTAAMGLVRDNPITEQSKCTPYLPYQVTKYEVEELLRKKYQDNGFPVIIVRPTKVYGIGNTSYLTLARLVKKGLFVKIGGGHNYTSNVHVTDFARALTMLADHGKLGETYIITSEKSIDFIESGQIIADALNTKLRVIKLPAWLMRCASSIEEKTFIAVGKTPIVTRLNIEMTLQDRIYDISKARNEIGFVPSVSMQEGIKESIAWYVQTGIL